MSDQWSAVIQHHINRSPTKTSGPCEVSRLQWKHIHRQQFLVKSKMPHLCHRQAHTTELNLIQRENIEIEQSKQRGSRFFLRLYRKVLNASISLPLKTNQKMMTAKKKNNKVSTETERRRGSSSTWSKIFHGNCSALSNIYRKFFRID